MGGAVHWLQSVSIANMLSFFVIMMKLINNKEVLLIVLVMARDFPKIYMEHVWGYDFIVAPDLILVS